MLMKTMDRLFILGIALLLCLVGMRSMNNFSKNRNLNGINVIGEAKAMLSADKINLNVEFIATGENKALRKEVALKKLEELKQLLSGASVLNGHETNFYDNRNCYFNDQENNQPCMRANVTFQIKGNIEEKTKLFYQQIDELPWIVLNSQVLIVEKENPELLQLRYKAIKDAEQKALQLAQGLGVKLGKLLVYSEQGFGPEYYGDRGLFSKEIYSAAGPLENFDVEVDVHTYHTYAIK